MRHTVCAAVSAVLLCAAPAQAQSPLYPGLSEDESQFLNCVRSCEAGLERCADANRLEVRRFFIDADPDYRVPADKVRAFLDCYRQRNECLVKCEDMLPRG